MANYDRSRSPVRAINTFAHPAWATAVQRPRSWSEPAVQEIVPRRPTAAEPTLACPDCGAEVQLALVRVAAQTPRAVQSGPSAVFAPDDDLPDFEESVSAFKRELIARALRDSDGVMTRAAKALGLKYTTFVAMVHRLDIDGSAGEPAAE